MDARNLAELYDLPTMEWEPIAATLDSGVLSQAPGSGGPDRHSCWLATIDADGSPHVTGIGALWADGSFWFETGETSRKGRNLARDPRCTLSVATQGFDLVVEGRAAIVTDPELVAARVAEWAAEGWPAEVDASGTAVTAPFSAPSAGPPPWRVYRLDVERATALQTEEPGGATTWTFS
jgi:hypothetical protein